MNKCFALLFFCSQVFCTSADIMRMHDQLTIRRCESEDFRTVTYTATNKKNRVVFWGNKTLDQNGNPCYNGIWDFTLNISHLSRESVFAYMEELHRRQQEKSDK